jgi:hypothetical protein
MDEKIKKILMIEYNYHSLDLEENAKLINDVIEATKKSLKVHKKSLDERMQEFNSSLDIFRPHFSNKLINEFYLYWTELNKSKTKMRFEKEHFFDLKRRLNTFLTNSNKFNNVQQKQTNTSAALEF